MTTVARLTVVLEDVRCPKCSKLLARMEPDALKQGRILEIRCQGCRMTGTWMGDGQDPQGSK